VRASVRSYASTYSPWPAVRKPEADRFLVGAQVQDQIVELARQRERPERVAGSMNPARVRRRRLGRPAHRDLGEGTPSIDVTRDVAVADAVAVDRALERRQGDTAGPGRTIGAGGELGGAPPHDLVERRARRDLVDETPFHGPRALDSLLDRAEEVGAVAAHAALVDQPREAAGAGEHGEQRDLRSDTAVFRRRP